MEAVDVLASLGGERAEWYDALVTSRPARLSWVWSGWSSEMKEGRMSECQSRKSSMKYLAERLGECMPGLVNCWAQRRQPCHALPAAEDSEGVNEGGQDKALCS